MEQRKIVIVDSASNKKVTVNTDATNFGELKRAARAAGINYEGKDWLEGLTKTSPVSDDSLLPVNVNHKGIITNNLVYMLTNTNKRIKSGIMSRQEVYNEIKRRGIENSIKETFGRNFTQVTTSSLIEFLDNCCNKPATPACSNVDNKYDKIVLAVAKFLAALPKDVAEEAIKASEEINNYVVEEIDFSKMSIAELEKQFG